ncbi:sugar ABC transporter substrate-binding protein [Thalassotalea insulae]|uniref:Sugar ABC transporter substrate-binding protein n=1 Tax=Thalassotalea insulae TaxID=2056778 RepID=A0ABQ6GTH1_9GAMM|nr:sugar ABC transporter substrate-binding protein [Thalassotalea insulae]
MIKNYSIVLSLICFLSICSYSYATSPQVTFIIPDQKGPIFWQRVAQISQAAADSLNIKLKLINTDPNRFALKETIHQVINSRNHPDYLIFRPFLGNTEAIFKLLEHAKIPFITLEQAFHGDIRQRLGDPQEKYQYWIGQINYDNKTGGKLLLNALISAYKQQQSNQEIHIVGIGGDFDEVGSARQYALEQLKNSPPEQGIFVEQIFPMYWNPLLITERLPMIKKRYPKANIYWCVGDQLALELLRLHQKSSSSPIIIGGFDWLPQALEKIEQGDITASVGGHLFMVANALVKIIDLQQGINRFLPSVVHQYEIIDSSNVAQFKQFFVEQQWSKINFSQFLLSKNPHAPALTVNNMLAQFPRKVAHTAKE